MASVSIVGGNVSATDRIADDANQPVSKCNQRVKLLKGTYMAAVVRREPV
jgi:hypothetical protein